MVRMHISANRRRLTLAIVLIASGAILGVTAYVFTLDNRAKPYAPLQGAVSSSSAISSVKPTKQSVAGYTVPADNPKYLSIPSLSIDKARIIKLGLAAGNQIAVPNNIYDTGWYDKSAKPGQTGAMFIYGHVSSWTANGVFHDLKKIKVGDQIFVTGGDNALYTYRVLSTKIYPYDNVNMDQVLAPAESDKPGLNLMTCTGKIIKGTSEFSQRLVVFTSLTAK